MGEKTRILIISCEKVRDKSCIACTKCFKAVAEKAGEFEGYGEIEIVGMTVCGDCPGLVVPKLKLVNEIIKGLGMDYDTIFLGTCMVAATKTAHCPIDMNELKTKLGSIFGKEAIIGTHPW